MMYQLLPAIMPYGIFGVLFLWLLYTTNKRNDDRERMYQDTIAKNQEIIHEQAKAFKSISDDVSQIKRMISRM